MSDKYVNILVRVLIALPMVLTGSGITLVGLRVFGVIDWWWTVLFIPLFVAFVFRSLVSIKFTIDEQ
jgi:hypothetical protein